MGETAKGIRFIDPDQPIARVAEYQQKMADDIDALLDRVPTKRPGIANAGYLFAYGPSYKAYTGTCLSNHFNRLRRRLGSKAWSNFGVSSFTAGDMARFAFGSEVYTRQGNAADEELQSANIGTWFPQPFFGGVMLLDPFRNDAGLDGRVASGGTTAKARASAKNSLDALIRMVRAGSVTLASDPSYAYTGAGWTALGPIAGTRIGNVKFTSTPGDKFVKTFNGDDLDQILVGCDDSAMGAVGAAFTAKLDGVNITPALAAAGYPTTTSNQFRKTLMSSVAFTGPLAIPVRGAGAGPHTLEVTHAGPAGSWLMVDCDLDPSPTPLTVIVEKVTRLTAAGYAQYVALYGAAGASAVVDDIYNAIIDQVVARFPDDDSIVVVDHNALGYDADTMVSEADDIHRDDEGEYFVEGNLFNAINALPARNGLVKTQ